MLAFGMNKLIPPILCEAASVARLIIDDPKTTHQLDLKQLGLKGNAKYA